MKIYLDISVLNRIFDDQTQPRILLETSSFLVILGSILKGELDIVNSDILQYENKNNPFPERKLFVNFVLQKANEISKFDLDIKKRGIEIASLTILAIDALHLASAEKLGVNYFITCDDRIIKKYSGKIKVINPVDFVQELLKEE